MCLGDEGVTSLSIASISLSDWKNSMPAHTDQKSQPAIPLTIKKQQQQQKKRKRKHPISFTYDNSKSYITHTHTHTHTYVQPQKRLHPSEVVKEEVVATIYLAKQSPLTFESPQ